MASRCRSWRLTPLGEETVQVGTPGADRTLWRTCRRRTEDGQVRCSECATALAASLDVTVRRALASEQGLPVDVLNRLASDPAFVVEDLANAQLARMGGE